MRNHVVFPPRDFREWTLTGGAVPPAGGDGRGGGLSWFQMGTTGLEQRRQAVAAGPAGNYRAARTEKGAVDKCAVDFICHHNDILVDAFCPIARG